MLVARLDSLLIETRSRVCRRHVLTLNTDSGGKHAPEGHERMVPAIGSLQTSYHLDSMHEIHISGTNR